MSRPTRRSATWTAPSPRRGARSTRPSGRPTSAFRVRCLRQFHDALAAHVEELRATIVVAEVGAPRSLTHGRPARDARSRASTGSPTSPRATSGPRTSAWPSPTASRSHRIAYRASRSASSVPSRPWNFPMQINLAKVAPALAAGNTVVLKPAPDTPWTATLLGRIVDRRDRHPRRRGQRHHVVGPRGRPAARRGSPRRPRVVHRLDRDRPPGDGRGRRQPQAACSSSSAASRRRSCSTTPTSAGAAATTAFQIMTHAGQGCAITTRLLLPRDALRRGRGRADRDHERARPTATRPIRRT